MFKAKWMGVLAVTALVGGSVVSVAAANAKSVETIVDAESDGVMSYTDGNGNIWCSENNGETWVSESDYEKENPVSAIEWWTYDEYKVHGQSRRKLKCRRWLMKRLLWKPAKALLCGHRK